MGICNRTHKSFVWGKTFVQRSRAVHGGLHKLDCIALPGELDVLALSYSISNCLFIFTFPGSGIEIMPFFAHVWVGFPFLLRHLYKEYGLSGYELTRYRIFVAR